MATDYDAPRKNDDDTESIEAIKERVPDKVASSIDSEDGDHLEGFGIQDHMPDELDVVVIPPQEDEFTCVECFIVKHHSLLARKSKSGPICVECAS